MGTKIEKECNCRPLFMKDSSDLSSDKIKVFCKEAKLQCMKVRYFGLASIISSEFHNQLGIKEEEPESGFQLGHKPEGGVPACKADLSPSAVSPRTAIGSS